MALTARKGISSLQLAKENRHPQKSAWFLLHRIREALQNEDAILSSIVEIDKTYIGGSTGYKHMAVYHNVGEFANGMASTNGIV